MWWWRIMVKTFVLQWHLSEKCNLKCKHCYQENHVPIGLKYEELLNILGQYKRLLKKLKMRGHINITGGEPLLCPHFFKLLDIFKRDSNLYSFSILTNGTLLNEKIAKEIASYNPYYVQVSLEGGRRINDSIRGKGTYDRILKGIDVLVNERVFTSISFTATHKNYKEFSKVVKIGEQHGVNNVWSDRYIPIDKTNDKKLIMNTKDTKKYFSIMRKERNRLLEKNSKTRVSMNRALQFLEINDLAYHCTAGDTLLTVMENGDLVPCRRMPIVLGNLLKNDMYDLYKNSEVCKDLRKNTIPEDCESCEHSSLCRGGLKCLTYAIKNDYSKKDINCNIK